MKLRSNETFWKPRKAGTMMAVPFLSDGVTLSNIAVLHDARTFKSLAIVLETTGCKTVEPGDVILFKEGQYEDLCDSAGDQFYYLDENAIVLVMENMFHERDKLITDSSHNPTFLLS